MRIWRDGKSTWLIFDHKLTVFMVLYTLFKSCNCWVTWEFRMGLACLSETLCPDSHSLLYSVSDYSLSKCQVICADNSECAGFDFTLGTCRFFLVISPACQGPIAASTSCFEKVVDGKSLIANTSNNWFTKALDHLIIIVCNYYRKANNVDKKWHWIFFFSKFFKKGLFSLRKKVSLTCVSIISKSRFSSNWVYIV